MSKLLKISNQEEWKMKSPGIATALSCLSVNIVVMIGLMKKVCFLDQRTTELWIFFSFVTGQGNKIA